MLLEQAPSTTLAHREFDRLELATIEVRWISIVLVFTLLAFQGRLTSTIFLLAFGAVFYNLTRTVSFLKHWHHLGSRTFIIAVDLLLLSLLNLALGAEPGYVSLLFALPVISAASWFGMRTGLLAAGAASLLVGLQFILLGKGDADHLGLWGFFSGFFFATTYHVARITELEVTKRREVQELAAAFERDRARLSALIDGIGDGLLAVDRNRKVAFYNLAATHLLERTEEDLRGKSLDDLLPTSLGIDRYDLVGRALQSGSREQRDDLEITLGDRHLRIYTSVAPILDSVGNITGAIVLWRDITAEKEQEEERVAFASIASHELRTPVAVIEGYLSHLLTGKGFRYDESTKTYLRKAHESTLQLTQLIEDILSVTRAESGNLELNLRPVDIGELVRTVVHTLKAKADQRGLTLKVEPLPRTPLLVTDASKVQEVVTNYIDNAIKFTDKGTVRVRIQVGDRAVRVEVDDEGVGLSPLDQAKVWQKFYRAENWQTRKTGGTGLGLYISKRLIEILGGSVGVRSRLGEGSVFYFTLPRKFTDPKLAKRQAHAEATELISSL